MFTVERLKFVLNGGFPDRGQNLNQSRGAGRYSASTCGAYRPVDVTFYRDLGFGIYNLRPDVVPGQPLVIVDPNVAGGRRGASFGCGRV